VTAGAEDRIARGLRSLGLEEALSEVPALAELLRLLRDANSRINLVSRATVDGPDLIDRHLLDSLLGLPLLPRGARTLLDIGSGGGFPALPLLLVRRDLAGTLVEATGKKARFLEETSRALGLTPEIVNARFPGSFPMNSPPRFDVLTTRAVAEAGELFRAARPLLRPGARALLYTTEPLFAKVRLDPRGIHRAEFHRSPGAESRGIAVLESST
jgi:16S rRNA (guanine527-N7)-methyltransferase